jgi:hypothetical protein
MAGFAPTTGASMGSVFVKRAGDACACFAEVAIQPGDYVTRLAERASLKLDWRTSAAYVELYLVPAEIEDALAAGEVGLEAVVLATRPLSSIKALSAVGIRDRSCLLARLNGPSAAAPGECVRERLPVSFRARRGWDSGFWDATPDYLFSSPCFLSPTLQMSSRKCVVLRQASRRSPLTSRSCSNNNLRRRTTSHI